MGRDYEDFVKKHTPPLGERGAVPSETPELEMELGDAELPQATELSHEIAEDYG